MWIGCGRSLCGEQPYRTKPALRTDTDLIRHSCVFGALPVPTLRPCVVPSPPPTISRRLVDAHEMTAFEWRSSQPLLVEPAFIKSMPSDRFARRLCTSTKANYLSTLSSLMPLQLCPEIAERSFSRRRPKENFSLPSRN